MKLSTSIRRFLGVGAVALAVAVPVKGFAAIQNALWLSMDNSGSIGATNFALQRDGYVAALNAIIPTYYGQVAIGANAFASSVQPIIGLIEINNATDLATLTSAIGATSYTGGLTAIGAAINAGAAAINADFSSAVNKVIDVSTDGNNNVDPTAVSAANAANLLGITTNCLGVGGSANCSFATGFSVSVSDYAGFQTALENKLTRELNPVPLPAAAWLFGSALLGLAGMRRQKRLKQA